MLIIRGNRPEEYASCRTNYPLSLPVLGKHVRACIVYTWDHKSSQSFWAGMKVQPILADEVQTFKALITVHKVLQEGHPIAVKEAQANINWLESLTRGVSGEGLRGMHEDLAGN